MRIALVGGFGAPPALLVPLQRALREAGHDAAIAALGLNVGCGEVTVGRLERWIDAGGRSALIGHSRGGVLGRVLAVRRPDLIERLITVATPWTIGPPRRAGISAATTIVRAVRRAGLPWMPSIECASGPCCAGFRVDMTRKPAVPWIALWSSRDRVAREDGRPPQAADLKIDLETSHLGAVRARGIPAIVDALAQ